MRKKTLFITTLGLVIFFGSPFKGLTQSGQLSITGQLRTRTEFRNGYGTLETTGNRPAFLTSQPTRLIFHYKTRRAIFQGSLQDGRVWGADASSISNADGNRLRSHQV